MGGYGSGRGWSGKNTTSDYLRLDVRRLQQRGLLDKCVNFSWQWTLNDEPYANIRIRSELDRMVLSYRHRWGGEDWQSEEYPVLLVQSPCHFGGTRKWFLCPARGCGRRVAVLYGGRIFACRHCHDLAYESQREKPYDRALSRLRSYTSAWEAAARWRTVCPSSLKGCIGRHIEHSRSGSRGKK